MPCKRECDAAKTANHGVETYDCETNRSLLVPNRYIHKRLRLSPSPYGVENGRLGQTALPRGQAGVLNREKSETQERIQPRNMTGTGTDLLAQSRRVAGG